MYKQLIIPLWVCQELIRKFASRCLLILISIIVAVIKMYFCKSLREFSERKSCLKKKKKTFFFKGWRKFFFFQLCFVNHVHN